MTIYQARLESLRKGISIICWYIPLFFPTELKGQGNSSTYCHTLPVTKSVFACFAINWIGKANTLMRRFSFRDIVRHQEEEL